MKTCAKSLRSSLKPIWFWGALVLGCLLAVIPMVASAAPVDAEDCDFTYEVRRGDTLGEIAKDFGVAANQIVYINDWNKPYTIYVGQSVCIPDKIKKGLPKLDRKYTNAFAVYFTAGRDKNDILIYTYNYPKTTVLVKVDNASDSLRNYITVGSINISSVGNRKSLRFKLPAELRKASKLFICLKDKTTSHMQCVFPR